VSYQVFARKYRPRTFRELLGQDHVVRTLENAIAQERLAHAYLFVGPRGTGKTSTARIFAKALNCPGGPTLDFDPDDPACIEIAEGRSLDVLEIDGASNNGVEQVRELRETVAFAPASSRFKIFYIDEVHMLSNAAFNALLKTLEEPPDHVKFIFATTEPHKVLPTIVSRCQRFDLRRIPTGIIAEHLLHIAKLEGIQLDDLAAHTIARGADGGMRDAQSMLDQLVAFCGAAIREEDVLNVFGFTAHETIASLSAALLSEDAAGALRLVGHQAEGGKDLQRLLADLISWIRSLLVYGVDPEGATKDVAPEVAATLQTQGGTVTNDRLLAAIDALAKSQADMRWSPDKKLHFEVAVVKACQTIGSTNLSDILSILGGSSPIPPTGGPGNGKETPAVQRQPATLPSAPAAAKTDSPTALQASAEASTAPIVTPAAPEESASPAVAVPPAVEPPAPETAVATTPPVDEGPRISLTEQLAAAKAASSGAPAPAEPAAPVAETLEQTPEPVSQPATAPALADDQIWAAALKQIVDQKPLASAWAEEAHDLGIEGDVLRLGFAPASNGALDGLSRPNMRADLETIIAGVAGRRLKLEMITREDLQPIVVIEPQPETPLPASPHDGGPRNELTEPTAPAPDRPSGIAPIPADESAARTAPVQGDHEGSPSEEPAAESEDFYNDPLIKDAMEIFSAQVEEKRKKA